MLESTELLGMDAGFALPLKSVLPGPNCELPKTEAGGGPAGVKEPAEEGGSPANYDKSKVISTVFANGECESL